MCTYLTITLREAVCLTSTVFQTRQNELWTRNQSKKKTPTAKILIGNYRPKASAPLTPRSLYGRATHTWSSASSRQTAVPNTLACLALHVRALYFLMRVVSFCALSRSETVSQPTEMVHREPATITSRPLSARRPLDEFWQPNIGKVWWVYFNLCTLRVNLFCLGVSFSLSGKIYRL